MTARIIRSLLVVPLLSACSDAPVDPVSPAAPEVAFSHNAADRERQTGHWEIVPPWVGVSARYSASAIRQRDGSVAGQWEVHEVYETHTDRLHGETTCLMTLPDGTARAGGVITHSTVEGYEGREAIWRVKDNGEGANAPPDLASDIRFGFLPEFNVAERFCTGQINAPGVIMYPVVAGNVQVVSP